MSKARSLLAVLFLVACGTASDTQISSGGGGFGTSSGGRGDTNGGGNVGGGGDNVDPMAGNPNNSTGSNVCPDAGFCPAGECCGGQCCTVFQMCCAGRCMMPTVDQPSCLTTGI